MLNRNETEAAFAVNILNKLQEQQYSFNKRLSRKIYVFRSHYDGLKVHKVCKVQRGFNVTEMIFKIFLSTLSYLITKVLKSSTLHVNSSGVISDKLEMLQKSAKVLITSIYAASCSDLLAISSSSKTLIYHWGPVPSFFQSHSAFRAFCCSGSGGDFSVAFVACFVLIYESYSNCLTCSMNSC